MSMHDEGYGREAGPPLDLQPEFALRQSFDDVPGEEPWDANPHRIQNSEGPNMDSGANRPGQPATGQRSIFGGNRPVFAQMPSYTPVTRGNGQPAQTQAQPSEPDFGGYGNPPTQSSYQPARQENGGAARDTGYNGHPQNGYNGHAQNAAQSHGEERRRQEQRYAPQDYGGHSYAAENYSTQNYPNYPGQDYSSQPYSPQPYQGQAYPSEDYGQRYAGHADESYQPQSYQADASFDELNGFASNFAEAEPLDASFPDAGFPEDTSSPTTLYGQEHGIDAGRPGGNGYAGNGDPRHALNGSAGAGYVGQGDPHRAVTAFEPGYDQPPKLALGSIDPARHNTQGFSYEAERQDADFLGDAQSTTPISGPAKIARKFSISSKSAFMVGSALLGAIALGGALAFAYKASGGSMSGGQPPVVQADSRPVKEAPDQQTASNDPAHKNKLIYDRLQNDDQTAENDHLVPRQEDLAVPNMPGMATADAGGAPQPPMPGGAPGAAPADPSAGPAQVASVDDPDANDGGPRRVKTMLVRPDGSMASPPPDAAQAAPDAAAAAPAAQPAQAHFASAAGTPAAAPAPQPAPDNAEPDQVASIPPAAPQAKPKAAKPAASDEAAAKPSSGSSHFVVQVGSKKNQTEALATFADMQQKYPTLLANYRPMVQKADLGSKGVWYRLRIGPIGDKSSATKLCSQLKSQGLSDCLVMTQ